MKKLLCEMAGEISMCWNPTPTGVFAAEEVNGIINKNIHRFPKYLEIRDINTLMPVLCVPILENRMTRACGFGQPFCIILTKLQAAVSRVDFTDWPDPWSQKVHQYIMQHWADLTDGQLLDFEYIRGEKSEPCQSDYGSEISDRPGEASE